MTKLGCYVVIIGLVVSGTSFAVTSASGQQTVMAPAQSFYGHGNSKAEALCSAAGGLTEKNINDICKEIDPSCNGVPNDDFNPLTPTNVKTEKNSDGSYTAAMDVSVKCICPSDLKLSSELLENWDPVVVAFN